MCIFFFKLGKVISSQRLWTVYMPGLSPYSLELIYYCFQFQSTFLYYFKAFLKAGNWVKNDQHNSLNYYHWNHMRLICWQPYHPKCPKYIYGHFLVKNTQNTEQEVSGYGLCDLVWHSVPLPRFHLRSRIPVPVRGFLFFSLHPFMSFHWN